MNRRSVSTQYLNNSLLLMLFTGILCFFSFWQTISILSVILFVFYLYLTYKSYPLFFLKYFAIFYTIMASLVSSILIEFSSIRMRELDDYASYSGSIPLFVLCSIVLMYTIYVRDWKKQSLKVDFDTVDKKNDRLLLFLSILVTTIVTLLFAQVARNPSFNLGVERVYYAEHYGVKGIWASLAGISSSLIIIPFFLAITNKGWKRALGVFAIIILSLYIVWTGNKFGPFLTIFSAFCIIYGEKLVSSLSNIKIRKTLFALAIIFILIIILAIFLNSFTSSLVFLDYIEYRFSAQNQLWWKIYEKYEGCPHVFEIVDEFTGYFEGSRVISENVGANYGIYKMMYLCASETRIDRYLSGGYRYTAAGYPAMLYYFSYIGPILYSVIQGFVYPYVVNAFIQSLNKKKYINAILYIRLFLIIRSAFGMFVFWDLFDAISILSYIYLFVTRKRTIKIGNIRL